MAKPLLSLLVLTSLLAQSAAAEFAFVPFSAVRGQILDGRGTAAEIGPVVRVASRQAPEGAVGPGTNLQHEHLSALFLYLSALPRPTDQQVTRLCRSLIEIDTTAPAPLSVGQWDGVIAAMISDLYERIEYVRAHPDAPVDMDQVVSQLLGRAVSMSKYIRALNGR